MRQGSWKWFLVAVAACFAVAACDPYAYYPARSQPMTPPPAGAPAGSGAPAGQAAPAPAPAPSLGQQVQDLQARVQQLEARLAEMEGQQPPPPASPRRPTERSRYKAPGAPAGYPAPAKAQEKLYVDGYRFYQKKQYAPARNQFAKYLKAQPRGPKAPEARYYLAFCFQHENKPKEAAVEFNKLANQFPKSTLAPAALKQEALAYKAQDRPDLYKSTMRKLIKVYPRSPEAREAKTLLKEGGR